MPWYACLFTGLVLALMTWWFLDEQHYNKHVRVRVEDDGLTALARAVGVYREG